MFDKRLASDSGSSSTIRFKKTTNIDENSSSINNNKRLQPVRDFKSIFAETEPNSIQYDSKIPLLPEDLLLYWLANIVFSSKFYFPFQPKKYYCLSKAVYMVYGVRLDCKGMQNYFYQSVINNLSKGLGKFDGHLRGKFYSNNIKNVVIKH